MPLPYYRHKAHAERIALESSLPVTVLRSTQFHTLLTQIFASQRRLPGLLVAAMPVQPIDPGEVAQRLVEVVGQPPAGQAADIGGPEVAPMSQFARQWLEAHARPLRQWPVRFPGRTFTAYRRGLHLADGPPYGTTTFAEHLERRD